MSGSELLEIAVDVDGEAAEAVSELFNRYNGGGWDEDSASGEASGGGAVIEMTGFDDLDQPIDGEYRLVVKTYVKPGRRGAEIRRQIEEGLWRLGLLYPIPEPAIRSVCEEDWAQAWKRFYRPMRIGRRVVLVPAWESVESQPGDVVVSLEPGMAFGTGMHPTTRLCVAALEELVQPGMAVLDVGAGSGVLSIVAAKLGAAPVYAVDIDPLAVGATRDNARRNGLVEGPDALVVAPGSVPAGMARHFPLLVANILAEVLAGLFDGVYGNPPLAEPLAPGGRMILSGIIQEKVDIVLEAADRHGFVEESRRQERDWVALIVRCKT